MKTAALLTITTALLIAALVSHVDRAPFWAGPPGTPITLCYEDEPCWNCETMGNKVCGP